MPKGCPSFDLCVPWYGYSYRHRGPANTEFQTNIAEPEAICSFPLNEGLWYKPVSSLQFVWYNLYGTPFAICLVKFCFHFGDFADYCREMEE